MSVMVATNVYAFVKLAHIARRSAPAQRMLVALWRSRWLERRRFARALPLMADEVLRDYGLTCDEAQLLCRRPFWLA